MGTGAAPAGGRVMVSVVDGRREPFNDGDILTTIIDGNQRTVQRKFGHTANTLYSGLPLFNHSGDDYRIIVSADGYIDAGFHPVHMAQGVTQILSLMLVPKSSEINFSGARWANVKASRPKLAQVLAAGAPDDGAAALRYADLMEREGGAPLACLLNIGTAMEQIHLPQGTPLEYVKAIIWDAEGERPSCDRFYAWADTRLADQLEFSKAHRVFVDAPAALHKGGTRSYKQKQFGEANLQVTLHENDRLVLQEVSCIKIECDIDYFQDPAAHLLLEVVVNAFGNLTNPRQVYALRWMAGQRAGVPEFDPLYTIVRA